jgi:hydroxymethylpyrimidine pyrophosphatase-like HAD family hydrolase
MKTKTIILDIDGTLISHAGSLSAIYKSAINADKYSNNVLIGTIAKLDQWEREGYNIILMTGRKESMRAATVKQLEMLNIYHDQLIMGCGGGARYLINDKKPDGSYTAFSFNINRNEGISEIDLDYPGVVIDPS